MDAALPGGECLHVAIPDATRTDWAINIRKYVVRAGHLDDLVALGSLTPVAARFLAASVTAGLNVLVSGPTQAGKTTSRQSTLREDATAPSLRQAVREDPDPHWQLRPVRARATAGL